MTTQPTQTQTAQNAQQKEYPASAGSHHDEAQSAGGADETQTDQIGDSWRPADDPAIEQAGGIARSSEEEPGRSARDGKTRGAATDTESTPGQAGGGGGA